MTSLYAALYAVKPRLGQLSEAQRAPVTPPASFVPPSARPSPAPRAHRRGPAGTRRASRSPRCQLWQREAEDVLYTHPAVREAAVVGIPDDYRGEPVKAYISRQPGASVEPREISAYCAERLAAYEYPRSVEILPELPKTTSGKILGREPRFRG